MSERVAFMAASLPLYCSFCGKSGKEARAIVAGPAVYICDECADLCVWMIAVECGAEDGEAEYASWGAPGPAYCLACGVRNDSRPARCLQPGCPGGR